MSTSELKVYRDQSSGRLVAVDPNELATPDQTARLLKVSTYCLESWRRRNFGLPVVRISSRCVRYRLADILDFIEKRTSAASGGNSSKSL